MSSSIESKAREWFDAGCEALDSHPADLTAAVTAFTRSIFLCPHVGSTWYMRGEAYFRMCDFRTALVNFRRAQVLDPSSVDIRQRLSQLHFVLGRLSLESNDIPSAVRSFTCALDLQPTNTDYWIFRIKAWIRGKSYGRALAELNEFITSPSSEDYFQTKQQQQQNQAGNQTGRTHRNKTHRSKASESYIDSKDVSNDRNNLLDPDYDDGSGEPHPEDSFLSEEHVPVDFSASSQAPSLLTARGRSSALTLFRTVQALILRAKLHVLLARSDLALRDAGWALHLAPGNSEVTALLENLSQKAEFLYGAAVAHVLAGEKELAIEELTKALELNPHQVKFYSMRSGLLRDAKRYDDALKDIKTAISISDSLRLARRMRRQQEQEHAHAHNSDSMPTESDHRQRDGSMESKTSISSNPTVSTSPTFVTGLDEEYEEKDEEQKELEKSLALTFNGLGVEYFQSGHFSHSLSCFSKCIDLLPSTSSFYLNRGDAYYELDEYDHALSDYDMAKRLDERAPVARKIATIHAQRGRELFNRQSYESALAEFSRALASDPSSAHNHYLRGQVYKLLGRVELSYQDVERAVWLDPGLTEARAMLLSLRTNLLRPIDQARAPLLPPVPRKDQPWNPSILTPKQMEEREERRREKGLPSGTNGNAIMALVYGDQTSAVAVIKHKHTKKKGRM